MILTCWPLKPYVLIYFLYIVCSFVRIGKSTDGKNRPLKIVLGCEEEKVNLMGNLTALRGVEKYVGISITEDLTQDETMHTKTLQAKQSKETKTTLTQNTSGEFGDPQKTDSKNGKQHKH